jgi:hypothetical protein
MACSMRSLVLIVLLCAGGIARAQSVGSPYIAWEVENRFRLFAHEADFERHVAAYKAAIAQSGAQGSLTLDAERILAQQSEGRGWAKDLTSICFDGASGRLERTCARGPDGADENYINPADHFVVLRAVLPPEMADARCDWTIGEGGTAQTVSKSCDQPLGERFRYGGTTAVSVVVRKDGAIQAQLNTSVQVRDLLIVGMGDSVASGEGNPDQPIALGGANQGFCFDRAVSDAEYVTPIRANVNVIPACSDEQTDPIEKWEKTRAGWMMRQCHSSLYGYQLRAALALAVENKAIAVTFVPLGCTGATITDGLLGSQLARERKWYGANQQSKYVDGQIARLTAYLQPGTPAFRKPDIIFLTIGANDIGFSGLVANVIFEPGVERDLVSEAGDVVTAEQAAANIPRVGRNFRPLRDALRPFTDGSFGRVVFVSYFNPTSNQDGAVCPSGRRGFDIHPSFAIDNRRARDADQFIQTRLFPALKRFALCSSAEDGACTDMTRDRMTFVDAHQAAFETHGVCATSAADPAFDNECFKSDGKSFSPISYGLTQPLQCGRDPGRFLSYASRQRWVRTPNDTFFAAMTYPAPVHWYLEPSNIHDALWAVLSAVYGGALHPTAEGHAAMADAASAAARQVLQLPPPDFQNP